MIAHFIMKRLIIQAAAENHREFKKRFKKQKHKQRKLMGEKNSKFPLTQIQLCDMILPVVENHGLSSGATTVNGVPGV